MAISSSGTSDLHVSADTAAPLLIAAPPNPQTEKCKELPHESFVTLKKPSRKHGYAIAHGLTGEIFNFPLGHEVSLHFSGNGMGYVAVKPPESPLATQWLNHILKWSVWRASNGLDFAYRRRADGWESRWLSDIVRDRSVHYVEVLS